MTNQFSVETNRKTGNENFSFNGNNLNSTLLDFWSWNTSDLLNNAMRGKLAEFIIANALGIDSGYRVEWDDFDLNYNGKKQFWNQIRSYLVRKEDFIGFKDWLGDKTFRGRELMPESSDNHFTYLGEWYWSEGYNELHIPYYGYQEWTNNYDKLPNDVLVTVENYYTERKGDDIESYGNTKILLFSKYIADKLGARWNDKKSAIVNKSGEVIGFNPILYGVKENSLLVRKDIFLKFLHDNNLEIIFTLLGEKQVLGREVTDRNIISGVYSFDDNKNINGCYSCLIENN